MEMRSLLMNFESLGRNREFGLFQRQFEAEPVGLLRWSSCGHRQLISALQAQFEGFGTAEQSEIIRERGEYWIRDTRYDIMSHTAIREVKAEPDYVAKKQFPILKYLRETLLRNLMTGEKIFVYQHKHLSDELMTQLQAAVRSYGPNLLMCVRVQDERRPAGTVSIVDDHNMVCYIDREGTPSPSGWDISVDLWTDFCNQAYQHWAVLGHGVAA